MMLVKNVPQYTFTITVLLAFLICAPVVTAKHIIVIYDVSGSMIRLRTNGRVNTYMESEDIRRVNDYLTNLLFTDTAQPLRNREDSQIKLCEPAYVGRPLYQSGDTLTYVDYADRRYEKIKRAQVRRDEFQQKLPDSINLVSSFHGKVSYLLRAEVEVYDELFNDADDETYWVFVTDGDIDNSGKSDPGISSVLKRSAAIEDEYYAPMIFGILVNNHVRIQVRQLEKRDRIKSIFIATPTKPKDREQEIQEIQLAIDDKGQFTSETLTVDTKNSAKSKFKLNSVNVKIVDKYSKPLQIVRENNTFGILEVPPVSLHGNPPPYEFRIRFPAHPETAAPDNTLKLEVTYSYSGIDQNPYPALMKYTPVIDTVYVAKPDAPDQQAKQLDLHFSEDTYHSDLVIQSENPNKKAFQINQVRCHIQYKDGRKLCDATVSPTKLRLGEPFRVEVPKEDRLDWYGNKLVLEIDYGYEGSTKSATLEISPFKRQGGGDGFPMWLLWLLLIPLLVAIGLLVHRLVPPPPVYHIALTEVNETGEPLHETEYFTLENKATLEFGTRDPDELHFDVGNPAFLYCDKKDILFFEDAGDDEGRIVEPPEILTLSQDENDEVYIRVEFVNE